MEPSVAIGLSSVSVAIGFDIESKVGLSLAKTRPYMLLTHLSGNYA